VTFQAQFNEALLTMYSGYHPDLFWKYAADKELQKDKKTGSENSPGGGGDNPISGSSAGNVGEPEPASAPSTSADKQNIEDEKVEEGQRQNLESGKDGDGNDDRRTMQGQIETLMLKLEQQSNELEELRARVRYGKPQQQKQRRGL